MSLSETKQALVQRDLQAYQARPKHHSGAAMPPLPHKERDGVELPEGEVQQLWSTPIRVWNLQDAEGAEFSKALADAAVAGFNGFIQTQASGDEMGNPEDNNDEFFQWQQSKLGKDARVTTTPAWKAGTGWKRMKKLPQFQKLKRYADTAFQAFLRSALPEGSGVPMEEHVSYAWTSVHRHGQGHKPHTHGDSLLSAVYYAKVPHDAGAFVAYDPRGVGPFEHSRELFGGDDARPASIPPFRKHFRFQPREGDLIVFPSWLVHGVEGTKSSSERVSFSFNLIGEWSAFR